MEQKNKFDKYLIIILAAITLNSCVEVNDTFRSKKLVSSKGESVYINSLNWGMTDDYQYTVVSKDSSRLKDRKDTIGGIRGLTPFIYKFIGDTLTIFHLEGKNINVNENFKTIDLNYISLKNKDYIQLQIKAKAGSGEYHNVPE